jgi:hypothetical protein
MKPWPTQIGPRAMLNRQFGGQSMNFFSGFSQLFSKKRYFRGCRRATLESFEGRGSPMTVLIVYIKLLTEFYLNFVMKTRHFLNTKL